MDRPAIEVVDGRIAAVIARGPDWTAPVGWPVVDGTGMTVVPGFIDAHVHLGFPDPDAPVADEVLAARAAERAAAALAGGVTTVRDLGSAAGIALRLRDAVNAGRVPGPRILAAGAPITTSTGHCHWFGEHADTGDELIAAVERLAATGVDCVKVMATGGMATPSSNPYLAQYTVEQLAPAVDRAHRLGLRVAAHALCPAGIRVAAAAGVDTLEHGWTITGRRQDDEPGLAAEVAASGMFGSVTTHDALRTLLPDTESGAGGDVAEIRRRLAPHRALAAAGVPMVVHSDAGPGPTRFDDFASSIRAFAIGMDVSSVAAIRAATGLAAAALGLESILGTVEARPSRRPRCSSTAMWRPRARRSRPHPDRSARRPARQLSIVPTTRA